MLWLLIMLLLRYSIIMCISIIEFCVFITGVCLFCNMNYVLYVYAYLFLICLFVLLFTCMFVCVVYVVCWCYFNPCHLIIIFFWLIQLVILHWITLTTALRVHPAVTRLTVYRRLYVATLLVGIVCSVCAFNMLRVCIHVRALHMLFVCSVCACSIWALCVLHVRTLYAYALCMCSVLCVCSVCYVYARLYICSLYALYAACVCACVYMCVCGCALCALRVRMFCVSALCMCSMCSTKQLA